MADQLTKEHQNEIASAYGDIRFWYGGDRSALLQSEDPVLLREAGNRLAVYRDLRRDPKVEACLERRIGMTVNAETRVRPGIRRGGSERLMDRKAADMVKAHLDAMALSIDADVDLDRNAVAMFPDDFTGLQYGLLDALLNGFAVAEIIWDLDGREAYPALVKIRKQERFVVDASHRWRLLEPGNLDRGRMLPSRKFLFYTHGSFTDPYGLGLGYQLFYPVRFKRLGITFWNRMLDKYGGPTAVGKYPAGTPETGPGSQAKLLAAAAAIQSENAVVIPEGQEIELLQAIQTAAQQGFDSFEKFLDGQIAQAVLGVTLTTDVGGTAGSRGATAEHFAAEQGVAFKDSLMLMRYLTRTLARWSVQFNMGDAPATPHIEKVFPDFSGRRQQASVDQILANMGFRRTLNSVNLYYGGGEAVYEEADPTNRPTNPQEPRPADAESDSEEANALPGNQPPTEAPED
jgi:hypothetical protein